MHAIIRLCNNEDESKMRNESNDADQLRRIKILKGLPHENLVGIAKLCRWVRYSKGQNILFHGANENHDVYMICEGTARSKVITPPGKTIAFDSLSQGMIFGELAAIDRGPRTTTVMATSNTLIACINRADFTKLLDNHDSVSKAVMVNIVNTARTLIARIYEYRTLPASGRIELALIRLAESQDVCEGPIIITEPPTKDQIAELADTNREAVSNHYTLLHNKKLIHRDRRNLTILDLDGLRKRVDALMHLDCSTKK